MLRACYGILDRTFERDTTLNFTKGNGHGKPGVNGIERLFLLKIPRPPPPFPSVVLGVPILPACVCYRERPSYQPFRVCCPRTETRHCHSLNHSFFWNPRVANQHRLRSLVSESRHHAKSTYPSVVTPHTDRPSLHSLYRSSPFSTLQLVCLPIWPTR